MTDDLKKIRDLVEIVVKKIRGVETQQGVIAKQVRVIKDQQSVMNDKLDNHTAALMKIEDTLEGYADMYKVNKENSEELEERVEALEDKLSITNKN